MSNTYARFQRKTPGVPVSEMWTEGQSFAVQRAPVGVNYGRVIGGFDTSTSLIDPPAGFNLEATSSMAATPASQLPSMPQIGRPESFYAQLIRDADRQGSAHMREAAKVGQYVTLALDPSLSWDEKLKFFKHALKRHCVPPPYPNDDVWMFYQDLADLVRQYAGSEALRIASIEDDLYASRLKMGQSREKIEEDAELFFMNLMGGSGSSSEQSPEWFNDNEWSQLKLLRDQWI